jgi:flagella basal body P-ring formation protein FlgA
MNGLLGSSRGLLLLGGGTLLVAGLVLALRPAPPPAAPAPLAPMVQPAAPAAPLAQYVVAARDIPRGAAVTADALRLVGARATAWPLGPFLALPAILLMLLGAG